MAVEDWLDLADEAEAAWRAVEGFEFAGWMEQGDRGGACEGGRGRGVLLIVAPDA
jgi:hypothetical protein